MAISWTNRAFSEYENVVFYLLDKWTLKEAQKFTSTADSILDKIIITPNMYKSSATHPYMRKAKISKYNSLLYEVDSDRISILRVIDTRSDTLH
ncbi:MAG: plasmid stabilization system protein ParE [Crocinitomicaceae bacterium]|jgi:plasmid stabilization system protein ParE